jgi:hypothetical protein
MNVKVVNNLSLSDIHPIMLCHKVVLTTKYVTLLLTRVTYNILIKDSSNHMRSFTDWFKKIFF